MSSGVSGCNVGLVIGVSAGTALLASYVIQRRLKCCDEACGCDSGPRPLPGPRPFPLVGNFLQLAPRRKCLPELFNQWANQYGPIYVVSLGTVNAVVLNTPNVISEALEDKGHIFSDRPNWVPLMAMIYQERGRFGFYVFLPCVLYYFFLHSFLFFKTQTDAPNNGAESLLDILRTLL